MLLSHKTSVKVTEDQANIIGHMCYAASLLLEVQFHTEKSVYIRNISYGIYERKRKIEKKLRGHQ